MLKEHEIYAVANELIKAINDYKLTIPEIERTIAILEEHMKHSLDDSIVTLKEVNASKLEKPEEPYADLKREIREEREAKKKYEKFLADVADVLPSLTKVQQQEFCSKCIVELDALDLTP